MRTAAQLALTEITKRYDTRVVLDRVSFTIKPGEKAGVIGDNGSGKSTLLKLMAGVERPDNGELVAAFPGGVGYLPQALELPPHASPTSEHAAATRTVADTSPGVQSAHTPVDRKAVKMTRSSSSWFDWLFGR